MYSSKQKETALLLYKQTCSATETVRILGYPTCEYLYKWVHNENKQPQKRNLYQDLEILQITQGIQP